MRPLIDLDFESVSFKARSDRVALGFLRRAALRRLTFYMSGKQRHDRFGPE